MRVQTAVNKWTMLNSSSHLGDSVDAIQTHTHRRNRQWMPQTIFCMFAAMGLTRLRSLLCWATICECSFTPSPGGENRNTHWHYSIHPCCCRHGNAMQMCWWCEAWLIQSIIVSLTFQLQGHISWLNCAENFRITLKIIFLPCRRAANEWSNMPYR